MRTVRITLPAGTMAVPTARRFTSDTLLDWRLPDRAREITELVVSELVGNAVEHGGGRAELVISLLADTVRVDVLDHDRQPPVVRSPEPIGDRHRGLLIVAALSTRWGTHRVGTGKSVWAELPCVSGDTGHDIAPPRPATADDRSLSG